MELFGVVIPLWAVFIGIILIAVVAWKLIKFAIKVLIVLVIFFVILIGLDVIGVFEGINNFLSSFM
ncbi:MAG: hypothetical protein JSW06_02205 [Thermoplasmatales archaeon]|nr:MAG: hypothetical protein JSW06_02205 [Thermoplasmatales archaeon]